MKLARSIHLDESDRRVYACTARTGEWCISGGFEFSNWTSEELTGKARQAFTNGWFGLETTGRATLVAVAQIEEAELDVLTTLLSKHFLDCYGAPSTSAARTVAKVEIAQMIDLCKDHDVNTILTVTRELTVSGVREIFRTITPAKAAFSQIAISNGRE